MTAHLNQAFTLRCVFGLCVKKKIIYAVFTACLQFGVHKLEVEEEEVVKKNVVASGKCKMSVCDFGQHCPRQD